jgi:hypothetical protein
MPMGVLANGSVHVRPSAQPPIDARGNFFGARVWNGESGNSKQFFFFFKPIFLAGEGIFLKTFLDQFSCQIKQF